MRVEYAEARDAEHIFAQDVSTGKDGEIGPPFLHLVDRLARVLIRAGEDRKAIGSADIGEAAKRPALVEKSVRQVGITDLSAAGRLSGRQFRPCITRRSAEAPLAKLADQSAFVGSGKG